MYKNLNGMYNALINQGPLSAYVSGLSPNFQHYDSGIYNDPSCSSSFSKLNHALLIVGYGTDEETKEDYWILKNSWSSAWGEVDFNKKLIFFIEIKLFLI